ncbi:hypothetical protein [Streptomyces sp. NPDC015131]|uniref:hypothetical protein n=1 Tax=Streptomyces sp. NPDC015131 TaxID=3364941 RepID=UPI003700782A
MGENVPVRCPACRRTHGYAPPVYPCPCGAPVVPPLHRGAPAEPVTHRTWTDEWVTVRCGACGRQDQWPQPELGCPCGTVLRVPVRPVTTAPLSAGPAGVRSADTRAPAGSGAEPGAEERGSEERGSEYAAEPGAEHPGDQGGAEQPGTDQGAGDRGAGGRASVPPGSTAATTGISTAPSHIPLPRTAAVPRPSFRPVTIRTARDAVTTAARYLRWLGFRDVVQPEDRPGAAEPGAGTGAGTSMGPGMGMGMSTGAGPGPGAAPGALPGVDLRGPGLVAQVDPTTRPTSLRAVECLWLTGLAESATSVSFSLAGYEERARARADRLRVPLFVMDLTGVPQPLNGAADELVARGA